ncbi:hypothetical protein EDB85DRAFT_2298327 [Lactarius pseudohatsudake]|nr:hypothetical protein EDB85DRAFT_2298327 [Lactarius pseudohatsudake]
MPAMIQPFEGGTYAPTTDQLQLDVSNQPTSAVNINAPSGAESTIWQGSLLAAVDIPNICFSTTILHGISAAGAPLLPFISQMKGSSSHSYFPVPYMQPQAPHDYATKGGDRSTDMGTVHNVEGNEFLFSPPFENGQRTTNLSDRLTGDADTNTQGDEWRSWNQPPGLFVAAGKPVQAADSAPYKQVAVSRGPDGQLLDASKMEWHHDPDDARPIEPTPSAAKSAAASSAASAPGDKRRPVRTTTGSTRLAEAIAAEKLDEFGNPAQSSRPLGRTTGIRSPNRRASAKRKRTTVDSNAATVDTDAEDETFIGPVTSGGSDDGSDSDDVDSIG